MVLPGRVMITLSRSWSTRGLHGCRDTPLLRLAGAVLVEAHDEWQATDRRYLGEATMALLTAPAPQEGLATPELMTA